MKYFTEHAAREVRDSCLDYVKMSHCNALHCIELNIASVDQCILYRFIDSFVL